MFIKEHFSLSMTAKFDKLLKNNLKNIVILISAGMTVVGDFVIYHEAVLRTGSHILGVCKLISSST